tara:strand:+ start:338 stop:529 length:192 start_codon:yes stop_codon:yes gene_type:complete
MSKISNLDLGSGILSIFILLGFVATCIAFFRIAIIGINYIRENYKTKEKDLSKDKKKVNADGF